MIALLSLPRRRVRDVILSPADAFALFAALAEEVRERFWVAFVDEWGGILSLRIGPPAGISEAPLPIAEMLRGALACGATALIVAHNHPGGDPAPSLQDVRTTRRLAQAAQAIDIRLLDHVVVARDGCRSFRLMGLI
jgi:DNA repair protein RadC